jgi:hypothetical protein
MALTFVIAVLSIGKTVGLCTSSLRTIWRRLIAGRSGELDAVGDRQQ